MPCTKCERSCVQQRPHCFHALWLPSLQHRQPLRRRSPVRARSPSITAQALQPQTVTASGFTTYSCVANGVPVEADIEAEATLSNATCTSVALPSAYSETVRWRDTEDELNGGAPAFSDITYTTAAVVRVPEGTAAVFSGTVTQGRYDEAAVQKTLLISNDNQLGACLTPDGLTSTTGLTVMQIAGP